MLNLEGEVTMNEEIIKYCRDIMAEMHLADSHTHISSEKV